MAHRSYGRDCRCSSWFLVAASQQTSSGASSSTFATVLATNISRPEFAARFPLAMKNAFWKLLLMRRQKRWRSLWPSRPTRLLRPLCLPTICALAGTTWYMQFFFYTMGETQMGRYKFSSWTLHMASIIIFSTLWGVALKEWNGSGTRTKLLVILSLLVLVTSTAVVGYGNYVGMAKLP